MTTSMIGERLARRAIEDRGYTVHDANILFQRNCPNIDLVVYGQHRAGYVQVKTSTRPAGKQHVIVDGSTFTREQLYEDAPLFNRHDGFRASLIVIVDCAVPGAERFYIAPPAVLETALRQRGLAWAAHPKRDGTARSIGFRKELPRSEMVQWENAWHLIDELVGV